MAVAHDAYRRLTLFLAGTVLLSNFAAIHLYRRLPDDPLHLAWHLALYAYFAIALSAVGLIGARKSSATLVAIFSNFLLIDTLISTIPRLVAITLFPSIRASVCSTETIHAWLEVQTQSFAIATDDSVRMQLMHQCTRVVGVLQAFTAFFALAITVLQTMLSLRVSAYARVLCRQQDEEDERAGQVRPELAMKLVLPREKDTQVD